MDEKAVKMSLEDAISERTKLMEYLNKTLPQIEDVKKRILYLNGWIAAKEEVDA